MAKKITLKEVSEMLAHVAKHVATKEDVETLAAKDDQILGHVTALQSQINSIERQLRETKTEARLGALEQKVFGAPSR